MGKFRKKPVTVEAVHWTGENWFEIGEFCGKVAHIADEHGIKLLLINTLEGQHRADVGDWIIKGIQGEFYPCKPDIFQLSYEKVEQAKPQDDLPENPYQNGRRDFQMVYWEVQQAMLRAGYHKCPKEKWPLTNRTSHRYSDIREAQRDADMQRCPAQKEE